MSDSLRYKIVLWIVWVQIVLLPIIIVMINVTNYGVIWRWNLINNLMAGGYILGAACPSYQPRTWKAGITEMVVENRFLVLSHSRCHCIAIAILLWPTFYCGRRWRLCALWGKRDYDGRPVLLVRQKRRVVYSQTATRYQAIWLWKQKSQLFQSWHTERLHVWIGARGIARRMGFADWHHPVSSLCRWYKSSYR